MIDQRMLDERDSIKRDSELGRRKHLADLLLLIRHQTLFSYYQTASKVISFSSAENTPQLVIMGDILRHPSEYEMPVRCKAAGQEHDGKKKDYPAQSMILLESSHNQYEYIKPHSSDVKLIIAMGSVLI